MPAVNDVGEPCAREPYARFDGRELEIERLVRVTAVGHSDGKLRGNRASGPTAKCPPAHQLPTVHSPERSGSERLRAIDRGQVAPAQQLPTPPSAPNVRCMSTLEQNIRSIPCTEVATAM